MTKNNEEMFYFFLTSIYRGEKNKKSMLKKSAKDCIYRIKCIEKILNFEISKNIIFTDLNKIE
jgi:ferritin-like metal-binding protein YciE